jgi:hypothetical protein
MKFSLDSRNFRCLKAYGTVFVKNIRDHRAPKRGTNA